MKHKHDLKFHKLICEEAINLASQFSNTGKLKFKDNYCYLKVEDNYINAIHPILNNYFKIDRSEHFETAHDFGAHISVIYPEEEVTILKKNLIEIHEFSIVDLFKAKISNKEYYGFTVNAPTLVDIRKKHFLTPQPIFKGHKVVFHLTIGTRIV